MLFLKGLSLAGYEKNFFSFDKSGSFQHGKQFPPNPVYEKVTGLDMFLSLERTTFLQKWKDFFKKKKESADLNWLHLFSYCFSFSIKCPNGEHFCFMGNFWHYS